MIILKLVIIAVICLAQLDASQHGIVKRSASTDGCIARWTLVWRITNGYYVQQVKQTIKYTYGVVTTSQTGNTNRDSTSNDASITGSSNGSSNGILSVSATYMNSSTRERSKAELRGSQLTRTIVSQDVMVPPRSRVTVWQLVAQFDEYSARFSNVQILPNDEEPEAAGVTCQVKGNVLRRRMIDSGTRVRLRHRRTGKYMVTVKRRVYWYTYTNLYSYMAATMGDGWEAATPGLSRDVYYRLVRDGEYVRIQIIDPMFSSYANAFASVHGGVYFDKESYDCDKQLWTMSIRDPKDGDAVTFTNKHWPDSGLGYSELWYHDLPGQSSYVTCDSKNLDQWIIEAV